MNNLTDRQKQYIWLAGSFPDRVLVQGRGVRSKKLLYALNLPDEIVVFGYSNPMLWLVNRGLFSAIQARNCYTLTDEGEAIFRKLLAAGAGLHINQQVKETQAKQKPMPE